MSFFQKCATLGWSSAVLLTAAMAGIAWEGKADFRVDDWWFFQHRARQDNAADAAAPVWVRNVTPEAAAASLEEALDGLNIPGAYIRRLGELSQEVARLSGSGENRWTPAWVKVCDALMRYGGQFMLLNGRIWDPSSRMLALAMPYANLMPVTDRSAPEGVTIRPVWRAVRGQINYGAVLVIPTAPLPAMLPQLEGLYDGDGSFVAADMALSAVEYFWNGWRWGRREEAAAATPLAEGFRVYLVKFYVPEGFPAGRYTGCVRFWNSLNGQAAKLAYQWVVP